MSFPAHAESQIAKDYSPLQTAHGEYLRPVVWGLQIPAILSYCALLLGLFALMMMARIVVLSYSALPYWDQWTFIHNVAHAQGALSILRSVWSQHNEHRIIFPGLLNLADLYFFKASNVFLLISIFVIQISHLILLSVLFRYSGNFAGSALRTLIGLSCFCLFSPMEWENFVWGFQTGFVLLPLAATASFSALAQYSQRAKLNKSNAQVFLTGALIFAIIASYSLANGLLLWLLLIIFSWKLRLSRRPFVVLVLTALIVISAYLYHYETPGNHGHPLSALSEPAKMLRYMMAYLSSMWRIPGALLGEMMAGISIVAVLFLYIRRLFSGDRISNFEFILLSLCVFYIGSAAITASGRLIFGIEQAFSSRYQTFSLLYWSHVAALVFYYLRFKEKSSLPLVGAQVILVSIAMVNAANFRGWAHEAISRAHAIQAASAPVALQIQDNDLLGRIFPVPGEVMEDANFLRSLRASVFADKVYESRGQNVSSLYAIQDSSRCIGYLDAATPVGSGRFRGYRATGWAWDTLNRRALDHILLVTADGTIAGYANGDEPRPDVPAALPSVRSQNVGWEGDLLPPLHRTKVSAYAFLNKNRTVCKLSGEREIAN